MVDSGEFRQDLFYRINVIQLNVPPLRARSDDILPLADYFLQQLAEEWQTQQPGLSKAAQTALEQYGFPGNIRELENILERAMTLCDAEMIEPEHLQLPADNHTAAPANHPMTDASTSGSPALHAGESLEDYLTDIEKQAILKALDQTRWNRTAAAKLLGMSFRSLRYRLKKLGLDQED